MFGAGALSSGAAVGVCAGAAHERLRQPTASSIPEALRAFGGKIDFSFADSSVSVSPFGDRITLSTADLQIEPDENDGWIFVDNTHNRPIYLTSSGEIDGPKAILKNWLNLIRIQF